jgi:hypothetical protein
MAARSWVRFLSVTMLLAFSAYLDSVILHQNPRLDFFLSSFTVLSFVFLLARFVVRELAEVRRNAREL